MPTNGASRGRVLGRAALTAVLLVVAAVAAHAQEGVPASPPAPAALPVIGSSHLPRDLSPWSMFLTADIVVQAVIVGLAFASVVTWTVWLAKSIELYLARQKLTRGLAAISSERSLSDAIARVGNRGLLPGLIREALLELRLSSDIADKVGIKERVASRLARLEIAAGRDMNRGTGLLATIGATAPFVGLFGTVWGIMNSFVGISKADHQPCHCRPWHRRGIARNRGWSLCRHSSSDNLQSVCTRHWRLSHRDW